MNTQKLLWSNYISPGMESSGSFFTSTKFLSTEHCHDFYELCLITEGRITHHVNGEKQVLEAGSLLLIRPDDRHYFRSVGNEYFQFINLAVIPRVITDLVGYLGRGFSPERLLDSPGPALVRVPRSEIELLKAKLEYFIMPPRVDKPVLVTDLRIAVLNILTQYFPVGVWEKKTPVPVWLDWLYREMHKKENFTGGVCVMQKLACKSPEHLCREFRKFYGMTPTEFINDLRLSHTGSLLIYSDEKIIEIAYSAGFQNLSHFCHEFKKKYLMSPSSYRKLYHRMIGPEA